MHNGNKMIVSDLRN